MADTGAMLENILNSWPRGLLAVGAILGGVALLFLFSPPHSVCQSQFESFQKHERGFLFLQAKQKQTGFEHLLVICREANASGGCYELFSRWRLTLNQLQKSSFECASEIVQNARVKKAIWATLKLMLQIDTVATRDTTKKELTTGAPADFAEDFTAAASVSTASVEAAAIETTSWLDASDKNLFCELKKIATQHYGSAAWQSFIKKMPTPHSIIKGCTL